MRGKGIIALAGITAWVVLTPASAAVYQASGTVSRILSLDRVSLGGNLDSLFLAGITVLGSCGTNDGYVAFIIRDDEGGKRHLSIAMSAMLSSRTVAISVDEAVKDSYGNCYVRTISLQ